MNIGELIAFILYFIVVIGIGIYFFAKTKGGGEKSYFLGDRKMNAWVSALSAGASDMSSWVLMGLPASVLVAGFGSVWIGIGLAIGTALSWILIADRLRRFSIKANDSITIPQYLTNRFFSKSKALQVICAVIFLVAYTIYAASSIKACGTLFNTVIGWDPTVAMLIAAGIIIIYTFFGGFSAVCWTDFFQGLLMLAALLIVPIVVLFMIDSGSIAANASALPENFWNLLPSGKFDWSSISSILTGLGWGLGYFGMPHIIVRFMAIRSHKEVKKSRVIGTMWSLLILICACAVGLLGRYIFPDLVNGGSDRVFINMVRSIFPAFISGVLLSAILAASMSTADSQLLASASAFASDVYKPVFRQNASDKEMNWAGRIVVIIIAVIALIIALVPNSGSIMSLVENAWGAFGAAFGPVIILSLFWKRFTYKGAIAGIIFGFAVDIIWLIALKSVTGLYEIIPGFIVGILASVIVSCIDKKPSKEVEALFDSALKVED
jgi:sodium/proline symporter